MRFPAAYTQRSQAPSGSLPITGAFPIQVSGLALDSGLASIMLGVRVSLTLTTNTLAVSGKWQVLDDDGSTWIDVVESNNPANVTLATGTGTIATTKKVVSAPLAVTAGNRQARFVCLTTAGTGAGGTADFATIAYEFRAPVSAFGG